MRKHFIEGMKYPLAYDAQQSPPAPCEVNIGDTVTFINDYGVEFPGKIVTGFANTIEQGRYVYLDMDCWWFSVSPESLIKTASGNFCPTDH